MLEHGKELWPQRRCTQTLVQLESPGELCTGQLQGKVAARLKGRG